MTKMISMIVFLLVGWLSVQGMVVNGERIGDNGGVPCCACQLILTLMQTYSETHSVAIDDIVETACSYLPDVELQGVCAAFFAEYGAVIIRDLSAGLSVEDTCLDMTVCTNSACRLHPQSLGPLSEALAQRAQQVRVQQAELRHDGESENPLWAWLEKLIDSFAQYHDPLVDLDGDKFSYYTATLRGYDWRGQDCDDSNSAIYAGRKVNPSGDPAVDYDCNGISGIDAATGKSYEDELCGNSDRLGVIILGDSAAAHFGIPPQWMTAETFNASTFSQATSILENEIDWPQLSWTTGHQVDDRFSPGLVDSLYMHVFRNNLCNHNDYQNIGVNGARVGAMASTIEQGMVRSSMDHPALVIYALIGNDVCNGHPGFEHMTTPEDFRTSVLESLTFLEDRLPAGSHVLFVGLVDGRVLWDTMHDRIHPVGVPYSDVYDLLNCLQINPCWGWLNSNETARNLTTAHAQALNQVYKDIVASHVPKNFDLMYTDFPLVEGIKYWESLGGKAYELIEPCDGFHESQTGGWLFAHLTWKNLPPHWIPAVNPNNAKITQLFGIHGNLSQPMNLY